MAYHGVNVVDKDNAGCVLLALLEQIANPASADADEHLHEIRTGNAEERNVGFTSHRACQQSLAGTRMTDQQHTFRNASPELLEFLRFAQKLDDLSQFFFGFVNARYIFEGNFLLDRKSTRLNSSHT